MRLTRLIAPAALAAAVLVSIGASGSWSSEAREVHRIRAHFDSVLSELNAGNTSSLSAAKRSARASLISSLRAYRDQGVFPHNYDFPGQPTPYFVDRKTGTLCAVAHLLARTGRRDVVDRVARTNNNVRVMQLGGDSAFTAWLDSTGISLEEAARIQVPYARDVSQSEQARNIAFLTVVPLSILSSVSTTVVNATINRDGHSKVANILGLSSSVLSVAAGVWVMNSNAQQNRKYGAASVALGGLGTALAMRSTMHRNQRMAAVRDAARKVSVDVAPTISVGRTSNLGVAASIRF